MSSPSPNQSRLPSQASVVVIGGGVMGCSTLYHLARNGVTDAVLLERNKLTSGTTWHSAAQVRALRSTRNLTDLIRYSIDLYSKLEEETGQATGWINKGSLSIATNPDRLVHVRRQEALARLYGVRAQSICRDEAKQRWPLMNADDVIGAVWSPDDGRVSPSDLCAALVKGARAAGAKVFEDTGVTGIETRAGRITGVETSQGRIACDAVALCTGLWSRAAAAMAGACVPVWPCEHFYLLTRPVEGISGNMPSLSDHDGHLYIRDDSGGLLVGCFEPMGKPIDPDRLGEDFTFQLLPEDWDHFEPMMHNALHRLPVLAEAEVRMLLNGPESFTPDGSFLLGETAETRGLFLGCGMNSVGVATGGGAGMALAHCIQHGHPPADLHEADPKRFADCFNSVDALTSRAPEVLGKHYEITYPHRQWATARNLRQSPLHQSWVKARAHFGQVFGWERPMVFGADAAPALTFGRPRWFDLVGQEVAAAHERVAVFDQSTFGKIEVQGPDACAFLEKVCSNNMNVAVDRAVYTLMLNERGGIESDLVAVCRGPDFYRLYVGTSAVRRDLAWLRRHSDGFDVQIDDVTSRYAVLALMGPQARDICRQAGAPELAGLNYFHCKRTTLGGVDVEAVCMSYVGESGMELTCREGDALALYDLLSGLGVVPAGTLAQTSMRIEKRMLAFGHELDTDISPMQAGLGFAASRCKSYIGSKAVAARRSMHEACRIVSLVLDDPAAVPLGAEPVLFRGELAGKTTSAAFGYRVGKPVALADITLEAARSDRARLDIDIAGTRHAATVHQGPVFDPQARRMRQV